MRNRRVIGTAVLGLAALTLTGVFAGSAQATPSGGDADTIARAIASADTATKGTVQPISRLHAATSLLTVDVPADATGHVAVRSNHSGVKVSLGVPAVATSTAEVSTNGVATYTSADSQVSVGVRVLDDGVQMATVVRSSTAGDVFSYPVTLPAGVHMELLGDGGVGFFTAQGAMVGGLAAPWAKDASGSSIPTHYEIQGGAVLQHVSYDSTTAFPVVADPWLFIDLIDHATWVYTSGYGWTFQVFPTLWARSLAGNTAVGYAAWNELYSKYQNGGLNTNLGSMENQLVCHEVVVAVVEPSKASWNIDEWRPNVGLLATINAKCNPGPPGAGTIFD
jgi:hypothetical protein